ncbi:hypothetical protein INH39_02940 [Massilia violaceinigra]|uniref:Uncharacterized protein n=1 Tax=Massilia violaceinigra TaxID=2045208 RepID=A0ABY4A7S1_9BURK|nr:hypothetical protein [Massilia violaceinigra]UOD30718.1 hypothetical protein INH39_02940 [Massilia violaceinigra]
MSEHNNGPRAGSRAYVALVKLHGIGGQGSINAWMNATGWSGEIRTFYSEIVTKLMIRKQVSTRDDIYFLTDVGREHIGVDCDAPPVAPPVLVGTRYAAPVRPLSSRHIVRAMPMREGAFDYLSIPSLQGATHVQHKTSLTVVPGDVQ